MSDTSLASCSGEEAERPGTPPTEPNEPSSISVGDTSTELEQPLIGSHEDVPTNQTEKMKADETIQTVQEDGKTSASVSVNQQDSGGDAPGNQPAISTSVAEAVPVSEDVSKSDSSAEFSGVSVSDASASYGTGLLPPGDDLPHPLLTEPTSLQDSAPPSPSAVGTPTKTPGKRKVSHFISKMISPSVKHNFFFFCEMVQCHVKDAMPVM